MVFTTHKRRWFSKRKRTRSKESSWKRPVMTVLILIVLSALLYGVWTVTRHPEMTISNISVEGGETIDHEEVRTRATELLRESYLFLIPKRFTYLYPHDDIVAAVERIPRVHTVFLERVSNTKILITFEEFVPFALWCRSLDVYSREPCLFVDDTGYAFDTAPHLTGATIVRIVTPGKVSEIGDTVLEIDLPPDERRAQLLLLREFTEALARGFDMRVTAITIPKKGAITYHISGGGDIIVPFDLSAQDAFDTLESVLSSDTFAHIGPGTFEYIDLRFESRVLIKEPTEEAVVSEESVQSE